MGKNLITSIFAGLSVFVYEMWIKGFMASHNFFPSKLPHAFWDGLYTAFVCLLILFILRKLKITR